MTTEESKAIATEILKQLGGNRFIAMTGASNFTCDGPTMGLRFKGSKKANYLKITLNSMDTYEMNFVKIHGANIKEVANFSNIYADQLQELFTDITGLHTTL